ARVGSQACSEIFLLQLAGRHAHHPGQGTAALSDGNVVLERNVVEPKLFENVGQAQAESVIHLPRVEHHLDRLVHSIKRMAKRYFTSQRSRRREVGFLEDQASSWFEQPKSGVEGGAPFR